MPTTPPYLVGAQITTVAFYVQAVSLVGDMVDGGGVNDTAILVGSTGQLSTGSLVFTVGKLGEVTDFGGTVEMENISSTSMPRSHNVMLTVGSAFSVSEILTRGQNTNRLASIFFNGQSKLAKFVYARGQERRTAYVVLTGYDDEVNRGRSEGRISCGPCDAGASTWAALYGSNVDQT
jgi:hypothetical protein